MEKDFIQIKKSTSTDEYSISIYFGKLNSTVNIILTENDFIKFLNECVNIINDNSEKVILKVPDDISSIINKKNLLELEALKLKSSQEKEKSKPEAEVLIYIPDHYVNIYLAENLTNASGDLMEALGFELETEEEPVYSSFFKRLKYIFSKTIGNEDLEEIYNKGRKALELKYVDLPTAEQTEKLATAAEKLINSLSEAKEGIVRCGALIVLKKQVDGETKIIIHQLTSELIILLDKKPHLIRSLTTMYELLKQEDNDVQEDNTTGDHALTA